MPEGTRRTPAKILASQQFALENNKQPLKHHLLPRPKGFAVAVKMLDGASKSFCVCLGKIIG